MKTKVKKKRTAAEMQLFYLQTDLQIFKDRLAELKKKPNENCNYALIDTYKRLIKSIQSEISSLTKNK